MSSPRAWTRATLLAASALASIACGDQQQQPDETPDAAAGSPDAALSPDADRCAGNRAPVAPIVLAPAAGRIDVVDAELAITVSDIDDPDGDLASAAVIELFELDDAGALGDLVWRATVASPSPGLTVTLADGAFAGDRTALDRWRDHVVLARYVDDHAGCGLASPWSEARGFRTDDGSTAFFDDRQIREIRLTLAPEVIAALNAQAYPPGCVPYERQYYRGDVTIDGVPYADVGVKTKGGCGSARNFDGKPGLKIALEWDDPDVAGCPEPRRHDGQKTLTLNNNVQDQSQGHERLAYGLYRAMGMPVPRIATVKVYVNDVYFGLYQNLESFNRRFFERNFSSAGGMLYEGTYWCDLYAGNAQETDTGCLTREFRPDACDAPPADGDDPMTYGPLLDFIAKLDDAAATGEFYPEVRDYMAFDDFLAAWAVEAFIGHWDGYNFPIVNNYRFYHDPLDDKWTLLPTGLDQTFGWDAYPFGPTGRIAQMCNADPECQAAFAARLYEVLDVVQTTDVEGQRQAINDQLRPIIEADPGREQWVGSFDSAMASTASFIAGRSAQIQAYLTDAGY
jgi:hypothetical protein